MDSNSNFVPFNAYVNHVAWIDTSNNASGQSKLLDISYYPSYLPSDCWINRDNINQANFYDPKEIYIDIAIISPSIVGLALLMQLLAILIEKILIRKQQKRGENIVQLQLQSLSRIVVTK